MSCVRSRNHRSGFTLVEIMIVVAVIGLLAAMAVPGFVIARKRSQGRRVLNDARQMDSAVDQWAMEYNKMHGATVDTVAAGTYLKKGWKTNDVLGNNFVLNNVGTGQIQISTTTKIELSGVNIDWGPY